LALCFYLPIAALMRRLTERAMNEIKIEKGIPAPKANRGARTLYPWREMEVGDSFLIPFATDGKRRGIYSCASRLGIKIATRTVEGGVRIWRIE